MAITIQDKNLANFNYTFQRADLPWQSNVGYNSGDRVSIGGVSYVCILANNGQQPPNAVYWSVASTIIDLTPYDSVKLLLTPPPANPPAAVIVLTASFVSKPAGTVQYLLYAIPTYGSQWKAQFVCYISGLLPEYGQVFTLPTVSPNLDDV